MAKKKNEVGDGMEATTGLAVAEVVDEAKAALATAVSAFTRENGEAPSAGFIAKKFQHWIDNNVHKLVAAFKGDVLG